MTVLGIYKLVFGVSTLEDIKFFEDLGTDVVRHHNSLEYKFLNGSSIELTEGIIGLREVHWYTEDINDQFEDSGISHKFTSSFCPVKVSTQENLTNTYSHKNRINNQISIQDKPVACGISHVALFSDNMQKTLEKFSRYNFVLSDAIEGKCLFVRTKSYNPHHQMLVVESKEKSGMQHLAISVSDIYSVITKGIYLSSVGYKTVLGPGRHVISSSAYWYFDTTIGSIELSADDDYLTEEHKPSLYDPSSSIVYEWAIEGGIDPTTRRQSGVNTTTRLIDKS